MPVAAALLNALFPPRCEVCDAFLETGEKAEGLGRALCGDCLRGFTPIEAPICPICGVPFFSRGTDHYCETCLRRPPAYDCIRALYSFEGPVVEAVHAYKFDRKSRMAETLGGAMAGYAAGWLPHAREYLAVPVPLHPRRLRERGFNQSALLARYVARTTGMELDLFTFRRVRDTEVQSRLGKRARRRNVRGAFSVTAPAGLQGRIIVLIDDVATTGSTLHECSTALKRSGACGVLCLVFARTGIGLRR